MPETAFDIGDRVELRGAFTNQASAPTNPTAVTCKVRTPSGVVTTYTGGDLTNPEVGVFTRLIDITESGAWWYRFSGTGAVIAAEETSFDVTRSQF